ncbi:YdeI/OmpD-associated family protein [Sphaerisporangium perillae]|uniref:YdeI/OmpD-associated family protein n=1 Tax=Sphaerisporangium perillae TaxID=2935860 RepID=UPI00200C0543|nr:YdeI/OmpD-associated family protein [Sphaerisporangium perillae]
MRFHTIVLSSGKTTTGIEVPAEIVEALGGGKRPKVRLTIAGHTFRNSVAPMNGTYMLGLNADVRQQTGVAAGDTIEIDLQLDTEPREVAVPADFAAALDREPAARNLFDRLSYSNRRAHVLSIDGAKTDATRQRRIDKSVATLAAGNIR